MIIRRYIRELRKNVTRTLQCAAVGSIVFVAVAIGSATAQQPQDYHRNSVAIVIGNSVYKHSTPVPYAENDARAIQKYLIETLGFRPDNVVLKLNLTGEDMATLFGEPDRPDGEIMDRLLDSPRRDLRGDVFVFYSGHGVPDPNPVHDDGRRAFLLPVDVTLERIDRAAMPIDRLEKKLDLLRGHIPADRKVILMMDACFSGRTQQIRTSDAQASGDESLFRFSRGSFSVKIGEPMAGLVRLVAATGDQVAYWDEQAKLGLFTSIFLKGVNGSADASGYGNGDAYVSGQELATYLSDKLPKESRRLHRQSQRPILGNLDGFNWRIAAIGSTVSPPFANSGASKIALKPPQLPTSVEGARAENVAAHPRLEVLPPQSEDRQIKIRQSIEIANRYMKGEDVKQDYAKAQDSLKFAASLGSAEALNILGDVHRKGLGTQINFVEAIMHYEEASKLGSEFALTNLGNIFMYDKNYRNFEKARKYYERGAELGSDWAMANLGRIYYSGIGVNRNCNAAWEWYGKAAKLGNQSAKLALTNFSCQRKIR
jgi:Caspase domain/Sel1 repeat